MKEEYFVIVTVKDVETIQSISKKKATRLVDEGRAEWATESTIKLLWNQQEFKRYILTRDNYICYYCNEEGGTIDHKIPRSKGGLSTPVNCVCACLSCNGKKGNMTVSQFREWLWRNGIQKDDGVWLD